jgi:hypothetical protein
VAVKGRPQKGLIMDLGEAKKLLEQEQKDRVARCQTRLQQLLKEEQCQLEAIMHITKSGVFPEIMIVPVAKKD